MNISADAIRNARKAAGITQAELSRLSACSVAAVRLIEAGYSPNRSTVRSHIVRTLDALGYPPGESARRA